MICGRINRSLSCHIQPFYTLSGRINRYIFCQIEKLFILTDEIKLSPFTLKECEEYFEHENIIMSRYDIIQAYMVFGGIPYYLRYFKKGFSLSGNIDEILFGRNPRLKDEYNRLFKAIFSNPEDCNDNREGAQIDLLIIRKDNIVNLCEMKFASDIYNIDKEEYSKLRHRIETLKDTLSAKQAIHLTIISTYGIKYGKYSGLVQKEITMDDLFGD